ncbi:MAG: hypothetical protein Q8898_12390 [Bacillota bacterium]|nr:hypothetical protein [Bacillota bacterium]
MLKNKIMIIVLGISLALFGWGAVDNPKADQTNGATQANNKHPLQPSTENSNAGSSHSAGTSANPSTTASKPNASPVTNTPAKYSNINTSMITAVRLADFNTGWVGGNGWIAKTTSRGKNWSVVYQGNGTVQQLMALNHSDVWATLDQGGKNWRLLHSTDGGRHWLIIGTMPNKAFLHFTSKTTALSGNAFSQNGGKTWHTLPTPKGLVGDVYFHDVRDGWAVTQNNNVFYVKRTINGGKSWSTVMSKKLVEPLAGAILRSAGTNDSWVELIGGTGMTQTSYSVFHTADGGKSWRTVIANSTAGGGPAPGFSLEYNNGPHNNGSKPGPLYVVNPQVAFMGGSCPACDNHQNSVGWTKNGGKTWVNSKVTLSGYGEAYLAISDANHGWWITTENTKPSVMYTTSDGGVHWNQAHIFR